MNATGRLLDTDCVIHCLKGNQRAIHAVRTAEPGGLFLSIVSYAELWEGVFYAHNPEESKPGLQEFMAHVTVLPVTEPICRRFGEIRGQLRKTRDLIGDFDTMIAATALEHDLTLLSNNLWHFDRIAGLRLESI